ncbi:MAG TPA: CoA-binding protein, partial [Euryarchaeota archaeon]|nr:CoA-binding protein [Euryarchaeota archaeon]
FISIGNMADLNFSDFVEYLKDDNETKVITLYIEGVKDGRRFLEVSSETSKVKPIVALKAGLSQRGAAAAMSHTGSLAGSANVYKAAFKQAGIIMAEDLTDMFVKSNALALSPRMKGDNWVIITNGGGVGVLSTDAGEKYGIPLPDIPEELKNEFRKCMPEFGSPKNPVDLTGMATEKEYKEALKIALESDYIDGIVVLYCHTAHTDPLEIAKAVKEAIDESGGMKKPVIVSFIGGKEVYQALDWLKENKIPAYDAPELAVKALATIRHYTKWTERPLIKPTPPEDIDREKARKIIEKALSEGREWLFEDEAKELLAAYGVRVTRVAVAKSEDEAVEYAKKIGFPVVLKIVSPDVVHKSDVGGVKVDIKNEEEVRKAYNEIIENVKKHVPNARIEGILIQEMAPWGTEVIVGSTRDPQFGPTIMFGLGGIFVEILKDVTFRVAPIGADEAKEMVKEIRGYPIIAGARGHEPLDINALTDAIVRISWLVYENPEIAELDANPIFLYKEGLMIADARVRVKRQ